jgi:hypothetical protein
VKFNRKRPSLTARDISLVSLLVMLGLIVVSVLAGVNIGLSRIVPGGGDFFVAWKAARAFLFDRVEPYSGVVATQTQQLVYGANAAPAQDPYFFTLPFYFLPLYFPFSFLIDPGLARGIWMLFAEAALLLTAFLSLQLIEWEPRRFFLPFIFLLSIFSFYSASALFNGSPAIFLGSLYAGILLAYSAGQDELTGALLVFALFQWEAGFIFLLLIFLRIFFERRWRVLAGFGMTLSVVLALSFLIYGGNWLFPFTVAILAAVRFDFGLSTAISFSHLWPTASVFLSQAVAVIAAVVLVYEWYISRYLDFRRFIWLACFGLAVTPLFGLRTSMSNLVVLFPAVVLILASSIERWRAGYWLGILLWLLALLLPWEIYIRGFTLHSSLTQDVLFMVYPLFVIVGLYWVRWWFLRPPRTWFDHVRSIRK